jgi:hypothetical protein
VCAVIFQSFTIGSIEDFFTRSRKNPSGKEKTLEQANSRSYESPSAIDPIDRPIARENSNVEHLDPVLFDY